MKKSLIALAVASAFAAPAFAATSNVDVYGKLHMSVSVYDDQNDAFEDIQISSNASRIGFKGSEDLGGGLSGIWQIESGVNLDEQNGTLANRNSFVGLSGGFGTVLLGNHDTPLKLVGRAVDLFGDTLADSRNVLGGGSDARVDNVVAYVSPNFSGFAFAAAYSTDPFSTAQVVTRNPLTGAVTAITNVQGLGDAADMGVYNLNATYTNGPIYVGLAYGDGDGHEALGLGAHIRAAGGFTFGNAKVVAQYDSLEADTALGAGDRDAYMVGGSYTMGAVVLKANYMTAEYDNISTEPEQFAIGADYNLSKRTAVYALYVDATEGVALGSGAGSSDILGPGIGADGDIAAFSLGVTHSF
jgi:predicted porin